MQFINVTGYKYNTEQEAINAVQQCNKYYSPLPDGWQWCSYEIANLDTPIFWYIYYNDSLDEVLGQPINFEVITQPPFEN
jgi:hypothetical protein